MVPYDRNLMARTTLRVLSIILGGWLGFKLFSLFIKNENGPMLGILIGAIIVGTLGYKISDEWFPPHILN